jgi:hypothetical protein
MPLRTTSLLRPLRGAAFALCLLGATHAFATPSGADRERARALMDAGDQRFEAKQYAAALEQYRAADEIMGVPTTGIEVGRTLERLGRLLEAREFLRRVSEFPPRADEPKPFSSARQRADRLLSDIAPRIPRVTLQVTGLPDGTVAEVTWDGQHVDPVKLGGYIEANPGTHHAVAVAAGFADAKRDVTLAEGQAREVVLAFSATPFGAATPTAAAPSAGHATGTDQAEVQSKKPVLFWVSAGTAAAAVAVGTVTGVRSLSLTDQAKQHCAKSQCSPAAQDDIDDAKLFANVSNVAFAVGAVAAGVGLWQRLSHREPAKSGNTATGLQVSARVGLGSVGVNGTF